MEELDRLFSEKNITESSKKLYIKNLERLNDNAPIKKLDFLKDTEKVLEKIQKYKPNTQRSYIISVVSILKSLSTEAPKKWKKVYDAYYPILEKLNTELKTNNEKTDKEKENWATQEDIMGRLEELKGIIPTIQKKKSITEDQFNELQKLMVLSLYTLQKPRRNKDYQDCMVFKQFNEKDYEPHPTFNVLDLKTNKFLFYNYKTQGTYKKQEVDVSPELRTIIDLYLKFHPQYKELKKGECKYMPFIVNSSGQPYTNNNDFTRLLYKIFNKKIGASMLRKIFLTDKYHDTLEDLKKDTEEMGTSSTTAENHYIKN